MRKTAYVICLCVLAVLVFHELNYKEEEKTDGGTYIPTARIVSCVQKENGTDGKIQREKRDADSCVRNEPDKRISHPAASRRVAYLTFDDGPSDNTKKILTILQQKKAVATFFVVGKELTKERETTVREALRQGNAIGVHTYSHEKNCVYQNRKQFFTDYNMVETAVESVTGRKPTLHRFPWGSNNGYVSSYVDDLIAELQKRGVKSFDWNVSGEDSVGKNVSEEEIFENVKKDIKKFEQPIILLHDSATMKNTVAVLPRLLEYIKDMGYKFDTLERHPGYLFPAGWR